MFHVNLRGCNSGLGIIRKFAQKKFTMARAIYLRTFIDFAVRWGGFGSVVGGELLEQVYATYIYIYMDVSKNRGIPKWMDYNGKTLLKWMIWGYQYFWKHPYIYIYTNKSII